MSDIHIIDAAHGTGGLDPSGKKPKKGPGKGTNGPSFEEVLDATAGAGRAEGKSLSKAAQLPPTSYIGPLGHPRDASRQTVKRLSEEFFHLIESYQKELGNPNATLRDIYPLLKNMESHRETMLGDMSKLPKGDPGRKILEEMAALVSTESAKFHRGEYV